MSNPKYHKERGTSSPSKNPTCGMCGKKHYGDCLVGTNDWFGCGKSDHKVRDCPNFKGQDKGSGKAQASGSIMDALKKNSFYAPSSRGEK